jgi:hypothetical protein
VIRTPKAKGGYQYAVLVTTLPALEPTALADAYEGRAMIEATFCQDKQALGLVTRRSTAGRRNRWCSCWRAWRIICSCGANSG